MWRQLAIGMSTLGLGASCCMAQTTKSMLDQCRAVVGHEKTSPLPPDKVLSATACTNYIYGFVGGYLGTLELAGAKFVFQPAQPPFSLRLRM